MGRSSIARPVRSYTRHAPFVDCVKTLLSSGKGGDGASIMMSLNNNEFAGPGGGNGGRGGNVLLRCSPQFEDLAHVAALGPFAQAGEGITGMGMLMYGKHGSNLLLELPAGTQVIDVDTNEVVYDLDESGAEFLLLEGGQGGKGNAMFASRSNHSPKEATHGLPGNTMLTQFELKMIADCGLIGFPNAGKSTVLQAATTCRPRIGAYPFTTLHPSIGRIQDLVGNRCEIADLPGLIEGAYENRGLGHRFLRHVERTHALVLVVDVVESFTGDDRPMEPWDAVDTLCSELEFYLPGLSDKVIGILANKMDIPKDKNGVRTKEKVEELRRRVDIPVFPISGLLGSGKGPMSPDSGLAPAIEHICSTVFKRKQERDALRRLERDHEERQLSEMFEQHNGHAFSEDLVPDEGQFQSLVDGQLGFESEMGMHSPLPNRRNVRAAGGINSMRDRSLGGAQVSLTRKR